MGKVKVFIGKFGHGDNLKEGANSGIVKNLIEKIECCGAEAEYHLTGRYSIHDTIEQRTKTICGCKYILDWNRFFLDSEKDLEKLYHNVIEYFRSVGKIILSEKDLNDWIVDATLHNYRRHKDEKETLNMDCESFCTGGLCTDCPFNVCVGSRTRICKCEG